MFLDKWLLIGRMSCGDQGAGVLKAIKGNIWATPAFTAAVVFSPQMHGSKWDARGILLRRMACSFGGQAFAKPHQHTILARANFLLT